jgi:glycosyltransferase involved in cell wall biosynthesis
MTHHPIEILHLAFSHYPADTRVKRETAALAATGRRVAVVALRGLHEPAVERCEGTLAIRLPGRKTRGSFVSYLRDYLVFTLRCRTLIARHRRLARVRVVHVHTLPDFLLWAALPARRRGARLVFDMHEIFPEFVRAMFPGAVGPALGAAARTIERWARRRADLTITVNHSIEELLARRPARQGETRLVVHNTADPADFGTGSSEAAVRPATKPLALHLVYHGTLTYLYGLDVAIRGVGEAARRGLAVQLTIIGDGPEHASLRRLARSVAADAVQFEDPLPQRALPARLRACDAGVVPTRLNGMTQYSLSTKLLEYVHLGLPVLAARIPSYVRYLGPQGAWYWTPGDPADLAAAIAQFAASTPEERRERARCAREAIAPYAWASERRRLLAAYQRLLPDP